MIDFKYSVNNPSLGGGKPAETVGEEEVVVDNEVSGDNDDGDVQTEEEEGDCQTGAYAPVAGQCGAFTVCKDGVRYRKLCADGLHFVAEKNSCDWPHNSDCQEKDTVTKTIPAQRAKCQEGSYKKAGKCCTAYRWCVHGEWTSAKCPGVTIWDHANKLCNHCEAVPGCEGSKLT